MGNEYGCTCSNLKSSVIFHENSSEENQTQIKINREDINDHLTPICFTEAIDLERDRENKLFKEVTEIKPSLTKEVKELLSKLPSFEKLNMTGKNLKMIGPVELDDKKFYVGCVNDRWEKDGYGLLYLPNGGLFEGYFKNNKKSGKGRLINAQGDYYEGEFENDKANKIGSYFSSKGLIYKGNWRNNLQHGYGEEVYLDKNKFEGNFINGLKNGHGRFIWSNGSYYEGNFNCNVIEGKGYYQFKDGRYYIGDWKNNRMHGLGQFSWNEDKKYFGEYKNNKKDGFGKFIWQDGKRYEGDWRNGKQHGYGRIIFKEKTYYGHWRYGKITRWLIKNSEDIELIEKVMTSITKILTNENIKMIIN